MKNEAKDDILKCLLQTQYIPFKVIQELRQHLHMQEAETRDYLLKDDIN